MDKQNPTICPVCSLYLREGITLKAHLQTHSKEKVIEALLNKENLSGILNNDDSGLSVPNTPSEDDTSNSNAESRFFGSVIRSAVSTMPSSSFIQSPSNQVTQTTQSLTYDGNNIQYPPLVNNLLSPTSVGNSCNAVLTYQTYVTNEGNVVLIPVYNMCPPSVVVSNNLVQTPVVNPCVVVPSSTAIEPMSVNEVVPSSTKYTDESVIEGACVNVVQDDAANEHQHQEVRDYESIDSYENEKSTDEEVANIFKISKPDHEFNDNEETFKGSKNSCHLSSKTSLTSADDETNADMESENLSLSGSPLVEQTPAVSNVSVIRVRNDLNYEAERFSPIPSTSAAVVSSNFIGKQQRCEVLDLSESRSGAVSSPEQEDEELDEDEYSRSGFEPSSMKREKEYYILPNSDIPESPPAPSNDFNFIGISKSLLTSASLISSVNKTMFADMESFPDEKNGANFFEKCELIQRESCLSGEEKQISTRTLTNYIMKLSDREEGTAEDYRMNVNDNFGSACSSRISPFDIQTDESMPARGELSGQESLSSTENSVWELQVQQNTCVQRYSISCKGENSGIKIGLHSLMTEMNIKRDIESMQPDGFDADKTMNALVAKNFKNKRVREFHCFYCKRSFDTWRLRQDHILDEHAEEDGLTVESLFGKKVKLKLETMKEEENESKVEEGSSAELTEIEDSIVCRMCAASFKTTFDLLTHLKTTHGIRKRSLVCPTCFMRFNTTEEYRHHIQKIHPYECMTCGKQFHTRPGYMLHQKRHMKIKPYSCDVCAKSFVTKQKLAEHVNIHTGDNPIKCNLCDSNFKRYSNYQQHKKYLHMNCKRKLKDFICDCGEVFHSKVKLMWHQEIHDEKPKQCPFCVERFVHAASLTRHVRKWHNEMYLSEWVQKKKNVPCPVCNVSYLHTSLQTHMRIHEGVKPFSCGECSKTFRTKWNLQLHRWTHMSRSSKPFKCKICVKAYIHKTDYDAHVRSHNNCRPYACNVCGRQFIRKYNCIRHMREHVEPRSYKCDICGKEFARSYYLTEHEKVHTGEKPHICNFCGKASATKSNHNKHVKMHTMARETINSEG